MPLSIGTPLLSLDSATEWLESGSRSGDLIGCPLLIHFWARSCPACKVNMPSIQELRERYAPYGLRLIAVHMPRGESDLDTSEVKTAASELGITEACAIDNDHRIGALFEVDAWPTYFLFGADGRLKRHAKGSFGALMIRSALERMFDKETVAV